MSESLHPLKTWRTRRGLNLQQAASEIGVSIGALWNWENGVAIPTLPSMQRISRATGLTIHDFGNGAGE